MTGYGGGCRCLIFWIRYTDRCRVDETRRRLFKLFTISRSKSFKRTGLKAVPECKNCIFVRLCGPVPGCKNAIFALLRKLFDLLTIHYRKEAPESPAKPQRIAGPGSVFRTNDLQNRFTAHAFRTDDLQNRFTAHAFRTDDLQNRFTARTHK